MTINAKIWKDKYDKEKIVEANKQQTIDQQLETIKKNKEYANSLIKKLNDKIKENDLNYRTLVKQNNVNDQLKSLMSDQKILLADQLNQLKTANELISKLSLELEKEKSKNKQLSEKVIESKKSIEEKDKEIQLIKKQLRKEKL